MVLEQRKKTSALCVVAVIAVLMATLWPFNPVPRNGVTWLPGASGLKFQEPALVVSNGPLKPLEDESAESYTLELLLQPASARSSHTDLGLLHVDQTKTILGAAVERRLTRDPRCEPSTVTRAER